MYTVLAIVIQRRRLIAMKSDAIKSRCPSNASLRTLEIYATWSAYFHSARYGNRHGVLSFFLYKINR